VKEERRLEDPEPIYTTMYTLMRKVGKTPCRTPGRPRGPPIGRRASSTPVPRGVRGAVPLREPRGGAVYPAAAPPAGAAFATADALDAGLADLDRRLGPLEDVTQLSV
jgi:hypothetical protein